MPPAERRIWYHVRGNRFYGWSFKRQVPLGPYVADFLCERARLIVEVDGGQHMERAANDLERTRWLEAHGYVVVRYWNNDVMQNLEGVLVDLLGVLTRAGKTDPLPDPPPRGREKSDPLPGPPPRGREKN